LAPRYSFVVREKVGGAAKGGAFQATAPSAMHLTYRAETHYFAAVRAHNRG